MEKLSRQGLETTVAPSIDNSVVLKVKNSVFSTTELSIGGATSHGPETAVTPSIDQSVTPKVENSVFTTFEFSIDGATVVSNH